MITLGIESLILKKTNPDHKHVSDVYKSMYDLGMYIDSIKEFCTKEHLYTLTNRYKDLYRLLLSYDEFENTHTFRRSIEESDS